RRADGDLRRRTADIAHGDPRRELDVRRRDGAAVGKPSLLLGREHAHRVLRRTPHSCYELAGIRALPPRGGEEHVERLDSLAARGGAQLAYRLRRGGDARLGDAAGALDLLAEREADAFLVE